MRKERIVAECKVTEPRSLKEEELRGLVLGPVGHVVKLRQPKEME